MSAKILVVDESPTIHKIVAMAFADEGITVEGIRRGDQALEYMTDYKPDIVLADIHLPGLDGYELCRQIKNSPKFGSVRVLLLTSDFEDIDQVELEISRADDFISKPFKTEEIRKKVKSQLKLPEPEKIAPVEKTGPPAEPETNEVIQNEFEDILNRTPKPSAHPIQQLFSSAEDLEIEGIELETDSPFLAEGEESLEEENSETIGETQDIFPDDLVISAIPAKTVAELPEDDFLAEIRPLTISTESLNSVFQAVLAAPKSGQINTPKLPPGSKPDLIDEMLALTSPHQIEEILESPSITDPTPGQFQPLPGEADDDSLGNRIVQEHIDQVMDRLPEDIRQGNSRAALEQAVRAVLREMAPRIIRKVIQEEIESIKKTNEV